MNHIKVIVISMDGLGRPDIAYMREKDSFSRFLCRAAWNRGVKTVYPSLTYPAHASIVTGRTPAHTGVANNMFLQPDKMIPDWYWYRRYIHGKTLYEAAGEKDMSTAAFFWPVAGCSSINLNVPEIFQNDLKTSQIRKTMTAGTAWFEKELIRSCRGSFARALAHIFREPERDDFLHEAALYTFHAYHPGLMLIHYTDLDFQRHHFGHDSEQAMAALSRLDQKLGDWMTALEAEKVYAPEEQLYLVVLGDHSSLDYRYTVDLNNFLSRCGQEGTRGIGKDTFYAMLNDGSCYLYALDGSSRAADEKNDPSTVRVRDPESVEPETAARLRRLLEKLSHRCGGFIEHLYTSEQARAMGADPRCLLMLEAREGFAFDKCSRGRVVVRQTRVMATHGYHPDKPAYQTFFGIADLTGKGPVSILPGEKTSDMSLIDEGPTIASLFGGTLPEADGRVLHEFFQQPDGF